jgi:hypothetical protein
MRPSLRRPLVLLLAVASLGLGALPAVAHETDPSVVVELEAVRPALPDGVTIQVVTTVEAQLVAENTTDTELVVLATGGEPFLRIGPEGVLANLNSPDWYRSNDPSGLAAVPERARDPQAEPAWARASREPSWGWFDHRLHERPLTAAELDVEEGIIARWAVPLRYGEAEGAVTGVVARRPPRGIVVAALETPGELAEGVTLAVLPGPFPGLFLTSERDDEVIVRGPDGEPFLRFSAEGTAANVRSPAWAQLLAARGEAPSVEVDPTAPPRWEPVAGGPRYGWLEPRARTADPPAAIVEGGRAVPLERWEVPVEVGGETVVARGVTSWQPLATAAVSGGGGAPAEPWSTGRRTAAAAAVALALLAAALIGRRRVTRS